MFTASAAHANAPEPPSMTPASRVAIRDVADGAGPSQVLAIGSYILVVDPWNREIRRYDSADMTRQPAICLFAHDFAPGRTVYTPDGARLVAEPYGPDGKGGYSLQERTAMTITSDAVSAMETVGPCRFPIGPVHPLTDTPPALRTSHKGSAATASWPLPGGHLAHITPQDGAGSEIFAVRMAGRLSQGRTLLWWSEIASPEAPQAAIPETGGRLMASQYVGVFSASGGEATRIVRIDTANVPPLRPGQSISITTLLEKPGLEYVAGAAGPKGDAIWIAAANRETSGRGRFELLRYDLNDLGQDRHARIALVTGSRETQPLIDRNDPAPGLAPEEVDTAPARRSPVTSLAEARKTLEAQIAFTWHLPDAARNRPCEGRSKCRIGADADGALGSGAQFPLPVRDGPNPQGGAYWVQPRQLVDRLPGTELHSVPYSIGGQDLADSFAARLSDYEAGNKDLSGKLLPPIGHIGEGLEWQRTDLPEGWKEDAKNYPLGIDCSALVARVFNLRIRSTGAMVRPRTIRAGDGQLYAVPSGPDRGCPAPVRSISELRPGDIILRNGHVVIFNGFTTIANAAGRSRAMRVFEATSRCGAVCESTYDPTFFTGWWMLRLDGNPLNCPFWLRAAEP